MLRESEALKNTKFRILVGVELILLLIGIVGLFGGSKTVVEREDSDRLWEEGVSLPAGVWRLRLYYDAGESGTGLLNVIAEDAGFGDLSVNPVRLRNGIGEIECCFYLRHGVEHLTARMEEMTEDVQILGLELISDPGSRRVYLFWVILISLLLDSVIVLSMYHAKHPISKDKLLAIFGIPALTLIASLPVLVDYHIIGADLVFHMMRIEALTDSICRGELPVRMESMWMAGHGYANSFFYGDTWLIVPALLRILGFSMDGAYRLFLIAVNFATALIAYISFGKCFKSRMIGMFGCVLYTLAPYRLYNMYNRAAVGEFTAMIFLPLLAWGFYRIYTEDPKEKGYLWNWVIPVVGFSGIIQSHLLTCEMTGFFVILLCLILWKRTFRGRTFAVLCSTVIMTVLVNAWFLVPCFDLMAADRYAFGGNADMLIQSRGIFPAQIFYTLQAAGGSSRYVENGMMDTEPVGMGAALLLCMLLWLLLRARQAGRIIPSGRKRAEQRAGDITWILTCVALFMSTRYFPWDFLSRQNRLLATLCGSLQFPTRITAIVTILAVFIACVAGSMLLADGVDFLPGKVVLLLIAAVSVVFGNYQVNDILLTRDGFLRLYTPQNVGTTAVLGAEYLPKGADIGHMKYHGPVSSGQVTVTDYLKDGLDVSAYVTAQGEGYVEFPLLYYKGYQARVVETGESLGTAPGDNYDVRVLLPDGFEGKIRVRYAGMWYWHVAEAVSVIAGLGFLIGCPAVRYARRRSGQGTDPDKTRILR
ncbi:MAG: hypothetical protein NC079_02270 [Clostridium sp.]|nr:hypothetical protein [Acetatifactor muris]MCM1527410.1 hypothetical protein [Bacteroides sp.]MCM1562415.1 hypothetical protein [Clostridium sp.]